MKFIILSIFLCFIFFSCKKEESCTVCHTGNKNPIAKAGPDQHIFLPVDSVLLNGGGSGDPDGSITSWLWTKISGPSSFYFFFPTKRQTKVGNLVAGVYAFELKVTDNDGLTAKDTVIITVNSVNHPPVANAGPDQMIYLPANSTTLDGSQSSDPDGNLATFHWSKIEGPASFTLFQPDNIQSWLADLVEGSYKFELKITDSAGFISSDTVQIRVLYQGTTELVFTGQHLILACYDPNPGVCWINGDSPSYRIDIQDPNNTLPNPTIPSLNVWIKMDTSAVWEYVPKNCWRFPDPYPQSNFTYCFTSGTLSIASWFFSSANLTGRSADIRVRY